MRGQAFDELTKGLAEKGTSRRMLLKGALGAAVGAAFGSGAAPAFAHHPGGEICRQLGDNCRSNAECCHRLCDSLTSTCMCPPLVTCNIGTCRDVGEQCRANADCCLNICTDFQCACPVELVCDGGGQCREVGMNCRSSAECCSGFCNADSHCDVCPAGTFLCRGSCIPVCVAQDQCHVPGVCDPDTGQCTNPAAPNGTFCETGNLCTLDTCQNGTCTQGQVNVLCPQCFKCDPDTGDCIVDPAKIGQPCSDGLACTTDDKCTATGACVGTPVVCQAKDQCHVPGVCQEPSGVCTDPAAPNGTFCETGNLCTLDTCQNGDCTQGSVNVVCPECRKCDPDTGTCQIEQGASCDDENPCTENDTCNAAGVCVGTPKDCDDGNPCTADTCNSTTGLCQHTPIAGCCTTDAQCDDSNPCTTDTCNQTSHTCENTPIAGCCTTDADCPAGQTCQSGTCAACPTGTTLCNGQCVNTQTDEANCGTCGHVCPDNSTCVSGTCQCNANRIACVAGGQVVKCCPSGQTCCPDQNSPDGFNCRNTCR